MLTGEHQRVRRICIRRGYQLKKINRHDPKALDYGKFRVLDPLTQEVLFPFGPKGQWGASLKDVEVWLRNQPKREL